VIGVLSLTLVIMTALIVFMQAINVLIETGELFNPFKELMEMLPDGT